jgi:formate--tetrahydrofolate ligase
MALTVMHPTPADYAIAAEALSHARPISDVAADMALPTDPEEFFAFGRLIAKIDQTQAARQLRRRSDAHLVLVTAMTPTPKGSGKTLTTIALTDGLNLLLGRKGSPKQKATAVLRQPSMGPVFGNKGGAAGGGYSQCIPMQDINLHFTGDLHAITAAHNLLFAMAMAYAYEGGNKHGVDLKRFSWPRAVDMVDRSLRELALSASGRLKDEALRINSRYVITAASEIMATVGIARNMDDLRFRLARIQLGCLKDGRPLLARDLDAVNPMLAMLLHAFNPNLVQTLGGNGIFVHCGPFANIAHGNASLAAMQVAVKACDYVLTEGGFAAELGAQKFFDIVCRAGGLRPSAALLVCSTRDLKHQGRIEPLGASPAEKRAMRFNPSVEGCLTGMWNVRIHIENLRRYGVPVVVAVNRFATDTDAEIDAIEGYIRDELGTPCAAHTGYRDGAPGAVQLAQTLVTTIETAKAEETIDFHHLYSEQAAVVDIIERIARTVYRAGEVRYARGVLAKIGRFEELAGPLLNVCMSKTQFSISDDAEYIGDPTGRTLTVSDVRYAGGPGWIVALCGKVFEMPGMDFASCGARRMELSRDDAAFGGFVLSSMG